MFKTHFSVSKLVSACIIIFAATSFSPAQQKGSCGYMLTPGDGLKISVYPEVTHFLNGIYKISDSGFVELPVIGCIKVTDRNITELEKELKEKYVEYLNFPNIQISPQLRAAALGGFRTPGIYWVHPFDGVWDLVKIAGGPIRSDGVAKIKWIHNGTVVDTVVTSFFESGTSLSQMGFKSGDQLLLKPVAERRGIDVFLQDVLPVLSFAVSSLATTASLYMAYSLFEDRSN